MTLDAFLKPEGVRADSAASGLVAMLSLRMVTHRLLDPSPRLVAALGSGLPDLVKAFMSYCFEARIPLDWKSHLRFLEWLETRQRSSSPRIPGIRLESMAAAASAWAHDPYAALCARRIAVLDVHSRLACGAVRPSGFLEPVRVLRLQGEADLAGARLPSRGFAWATGSCWILTDWLQA